MAFLKRFNAQTRSDGESLVESVLRNIRHILNTKEGYGSMMPNFGITDLTHCSSRDAIIERLSEQIELALNQYETRIDFQGIEALPNERISEISLLLKCRLKGESTTFDLIFDSARTSVQVERSAL